MSGGSSSWSSGGARGAVRTAAPLTSMNSSHHHSSSSSSAHHAHSKRLTPLELLQRHELPLAVYLKTPSAPPRGVDPKRPLLLYRRSTAAKVRAESLRTSSDGHLTSVGPGLVLPDSYTGWFSLMGSRGATASCFSSMSLLVKARPNCFLTRHDIPAYMQPQGGKSASAQYVKGVVKGGEVLKLLAIYGGSSEEGEKKFAQCLNYKKEMVLVPLTATGKFYITANKNSSGREKVYLISQIMKKFHFPLTVKLVCGYMPRSPCGFTGVLRLQQSQKESVILACTMTSRADATFMEMDLHSNFLLSPVSDPMFSKSPIYLKTLSYCQDEADEWQRQIKITHHVTERRSRSLTRSFSDKFVEWPMNSRPLSMSSLTNLDKIKPKPVYSSDNHIGKLASKVRKIKETKRKDSCGKENNDVDVKPSSVGSKLFEKHRKLSKQNTYVKDISRISNRPLPDPHEKETEKKNNRMNLMNGLNSLRRYKNKNRPLPKPSEETSEDEGMYPRYFKSSSSGGGFEYSPSSEDFSPLPQSLYDETDEEEDMEENLYSEIDEYSIRPRPVDDSEDEFVDSAAYSNDSSSKENSVDMKTTTNIKRHFKSQGVVRSFHIQAMIHDIETDENNSKTTNVNDKDGELPEPSPEEEQSTKNQLEITQEFCDSLEDLSLLIPSREVTSSSLKTFIDEGGTIKKKYKERQRNVNLYESLEDSEISDKKSGENLAEVEEKSLDSTTKSISEEISRKELSPYMSMITMADSEGAENQTSISIMKQSVSALECSPKARPTESAIGAKDRSISTRGNTILIKVLDDPVPLQPQEVKVTSDRSEEITDLKLRKCSSVSSINILSEENEKELLLAAQEARNNNADFVHKRFPSMITINESSGPEHSEMINSISVNNYGGTFSEASNGASNQNISSNIGIEILSASNELIINCNGEDVSRKKKISTDSDSKSVDSGNATDDIEASEDSFDNDSLDGDSEDNTRKNSDRFEDIDTLIFEDDSNTGSTPCSESDRTDDSDEYAAVNEIFADHLRSLVEKLASEHLTTPSVSAVPYHEMLPPLPEVDEDKIVENTEGQENPDTDQSLYLSELQLKESGINNLDEDSLATDSDSKNDSFDSLDNSFSEDCRQKMEMANHEEIAEEKMLVTTKEIQLNDSLDFGVTSA